MADATKPETDTPKKKPESRPRPQPELTMQAMIEDLSTKAPSAEAREHLAGIADAMRADPEWFKIGDSQYVLEWSRQGSQAGLVAVKTIEALRRGPAGQIEVLRPPIVATVEQLDTRSSKTICVGLTELSLDDAIAVRLALTAAIDHVEQQLGEGTGGHGTA